MDRRGQAARAHAGLIVSIVEVRPAGFPLREPLLTDNKVPALQYLTQRKG